MVAANMDKASIQDAYARWAPVYDMIFGSITRTGRTAAVQAVNRVGGRVLECGVGTGIALKDYDKTCNVTGIDLSLDMLQQARSRSAGILKQVNGILQMDAGRLAFPDQTFDVSVAMYLITVVPEPEAVMAELARVTKPGGEVILVNHFSADGGIRALIEKAAAPFGDRLGWRPEFPFSRILGEDSLTMIERRPAGFGGLFTLVRFRKGEAQNR